MPPTKGRISERLRSARQVTIATTAVATGTGARNNMLGKTNQREAIVGFMIGVQTLTMAIATKTPIRQTRP